MKIGLSGIVYDHLSTLQDGRTGRISIIDLIIFYGFPIAISIWAFFDNISFDQTIVGQSIAVFAIFTALLFSVQVALFGIYTKKRGDVDEYGKAFEERRLKARRELIRETNANISYLIVVSAASVSILLSALVLELTDRYESAAAIFVYVHFMLTLLMVIKRVHALFDKEYRLDES